MSNDFRNPGYVPSLDPSAVIGKSGFHGGGGGGHHSHGGFPRGGFFPIGAYPVIIEVDDDLAAANRFRGEDFIGFDDSRDWDGNYDLDPTGGWMSKTGGVR